MVVIFFKDINPFELYCAPKSKGMKSKHQNYSEIIGK